MNEIGTFELYWQDDWTELAIGHKQLLTLATMSRCSFVLLKFRARSSMQSESLWQAYTHCWYSMVSGTLSRKIRKASHTASWQTVNGNYLEKAVRELCWDDWEKRPDKNRPGHLKLIICTADRGIKYLIVFSMQPFSAIISFCQHSCYGYLIKSIS